VLEDAADCRCSALFRNHEPAENQSLAPDCLARAGAREAQLGIDLAGVRTQADFWRTLDTLWEALRRGEIGIAAAAEIARRAGSLLPAPPSLWELEQRLARAEARLAEERIGFHATGSRAAMGAGLTIAAPADESAREPELRKAAQS
jgi:hypothetical protein